VSTYVPRVAAKTKRKIEAEAIAFLSRHFSERLTTPGRLDVLEMWELLTEEHGLQTGVEELSDGVEGMTWPDGRVFVSEATYRGAAEHDGRSRFTMCHEAYHGLEHRQQVQNVLVDTGELALYRRHDLAPCVDPEWQANVFAASILMPWPPVKAVLAEAANTPIEDLMYFFKVSKSAARIRLQEFRRRKDL
jgi:hypothetical protein